MQLTLPRTGEGLGIALEHSTNRVLQLNESAAKHGIQPGDVVLGVEDTVVTYIASGNPGIEDGTPMPRMPASQAVDPTKREVTLTVLRMPFAGAESTPPVAAPAEAERSVEQPEPDAFDEAEQATATKEWERQQAANTEALENYPWAHDFVTADGQVKPMYNVKRGTVLQPLPQVQPSMGASLRKQAFANLR